MAKNIDEAKEDVKNFLIRGNRPFSCTDVANNFQNKYGKTIIQKALDILVEQNDVIEKLNGKQKIYFISQQKNIEFNDDESMKNLQEKITALNHNKNELQKLINDKQMKLNSFKSHVLIKNHYETLLKEIDELRSQINEYETKLSDTNTDIDRCDEKASNLKLKRKNLIDEWRKRKRMATGMINTIMENYNKNKKDFYEEVGIETDEDYNVTFPSDV